MLNNVEPGTSSRHTNMLGGNLRDAGWQREHMSPNRLAILPDHTHYDIFMAPELAQTVLPFSTGTADPRTGRNRYNTRRETPAAVGLPVDSGQAPHEAWRI